MGVQRGEDREAQSGQFSMLLFLLIQSGYKRDIKDVHEMITCGCVFSELLTVSLHVLSIFLPLFPFSVRFHCSLRLQCISFRSFVFSL